MSWVFEFDATDREKDKREAFLGSLVICSGMRVRVGAYKVTIERAASLPTEEEQRIEAARAEASILEPEEGS